MKNLIKKIILIIVPFTAFAGPDWSRNVEINSPRENIYELPPELFEKVVLEGRKHILFYPVKTTKLLLPYDPLKKFFETKPADPVRKLLYDLTKVVSPFKNMNDLYSWLGLHEFPINVQSENPNTLPLLTAEEKKLPMGATLKEIENATGLTFSCAACHVSDLFGVKVLGLTNRFPRANHFFHKGANLAPYINSFVFKGMLKSSEEERLMFLNSKRALRSVGVMNPKVLGLDTSLAQIALSLSKRNLDEYATKNKQLEKRPRPNKLEKMVADSKPLVWWNVKYKNRWLADGSIVSGNPIHTNFLWNEIGRGADLKELENWMKDNSEDIEALTAAVFATKPPRYEVFFGENAIDIARAQRGQKHYEQSCQKCHGTYQKGWDHPDAHGLTKIELLQNINVTYHKQTPIKDVGTDPGRYLGMNEFAADLNRLAISKSINTIVEPQKGYVPPPLDGIWARWPYFHNNSIPNLCALLTKRSDRPKSYWAGAAKDKNKDFDQECVGYPTGNKTPAQWKKQDKEYFYDTKKEGLSNAGHDERIFIKDGKEIYSPKEKLELIEFLKTL